MVAAEASWPILRNLMTAGAQILGGRKRWQRRRRLAVRWLRSRWRRGWDARFRFTYRRSLAFIPVRGELAHVLNRRGLLGRGVEVGVAKGRYSDLILRHWKGRELVSVDPWESRPENHDHARELLAAHGSRSRIQRMRSLEAAPHFSDGTLDFVYIDAAHDYGSVLADLEAWYPKVRPGGIFAGHDYEPGSDVRRAVDEFCARQGIKPRATIREPAKRRDGRVRRKAISWVAEVPEGGGGART